MIPKKLWKDGILYQSKKLIELYVKKLNDLGLYEESKNYDEKKNKKNIGGESLSDTHHHFIGRFLTSAARVQFLLIDPRKDLFEVSTDLKATFIGGKISILDIPSGTGASMLSFLYNLYEFRQNKLLPRIPLFINIIAADYSEEALSIYRELLSKAKKDLIEEFIFIEYEVYEWDASNTQSTNKLLNTWLKDEQKYEEFYVLMSAFSGAGVKNYKSFEESFKYIQIRLSHLFSTILYIEPKSRYGDSFLDFIKTKVTKGVSWLFGKEASSGEERFTWYDEIRDNHPKSNIIVKLYKRH